MPSRDADEDSIAVSLAFLRAVKKVAKKQGIRSPPQEWALDKSQIYLEGGNQLSPELLAKEVLVDWREAESRRNVSAAPMAAPTGPGVVTSLVLAVTFKPFVECFRDVVWGGVEPPFTTESATGVWLELMHRAEMKVTGEYLTLPDTKTLPEFNLNIPDASRQRWIVPTGGILEKLYLLCTALAVASEWWTVDNVLKFVLLGWLPSAVRVQTQSAGNFTRTMTITINGPVTEEELVKEYRRGCETAQIVPQSISQVHIRLLFLVHYHMPEASWPKRFRQWLEWCKDDESLPKYGAELKEDGTIKNPGGYRNLKREYQRAMDRQSWTGKVPKLLRPDELRAWTKQAIQSLSATASPSAPWEQPDFDTSGFDYPDSVNLGVLKKLCDEAQTLLSNEIKTFWQYETKPK